MGRIFSILRKICSSSPRPAARSPPPQPVHHAPPPAPVHSSSGGSMLGGIGSTIAQGMAFGTGSAVAHRAVDAVMGPRTIQHETVVSEAVAPPAPAATNMGDSCSVHSKAFQDEKLRFDDEFLSAVSCLTNYRPLVVSGLLLIAMVTTLKDFPSEDTIGGNWIWCS
ncbi:UNVERIFIED_CONTAM: hypothetical protein Sradi_1467000 [Sesamum radiatum]|uniref:Uncharacterized protein n=1 Tax=Sesamum radiatum TaxID=300843 RepID=A0AAW2U7Z6_SESRA